MADRARPLRRGHGRGSGGAARRPREEAKQPLAAGRDVARCLIAFAWPRRGSSWSAGRGCSPGCLQAGSATERCLPGRVTDAARWPPQNARVRGAAAVAAARRAAVAVVVLFASPVDRCPHPWTPSSAKLCIVRGDLVVLTTTSPGVGSTVASRTSARYRQPGDVTRVNGRATPLPSQKNARPPTRAPFHKDWATTVDSIVRAFDESRRLDPPRGPPFRFVECQRGRRRRRRCRGAPPHARCRTTCRWPLPLPPPPRYKSAAADPALRARPRPCFRR